MQNSIKTVVLGLTMAIFAIVPSMTSAFAPSESGAPAAAPTTGTTGASVDSSAPTTGSTAVSTEVSTTAAPSTGNSDTSAGTSVPPTGGSSSSAGSTVPPTGGSSSSAGTGTIPPTGTSNTSAGEVVVTPQTPIVNGGGGDGFGGGSYGGGSNQNVVTLKTSSSCPLITSKMLKKGIVNDQSQVAKLQAFLKNTEKLNVTVSGTFDEQTEAAVRAFQTKYANDILMPWGGRKTSGIVYITTSKKINQISCNQPLSLSMSELNTINAFKANRVSAIAITTNNTDQDSTVTNTNVDTTDVSSTTDSDDIGTTDTANDSNVASPARVPLAVRFWNFIVSLFK